MRVDHGKQKSAATSVLAEQAKQTHLHTVLKIIVGLGQINGKFWHGKSVHQKLQPYFVSYSMC